MSKDNDSLREVIALLSRRLDKLETRSRAYERILRVAGKQQKQVLESVKSYEDEQKAAKLELKRLAKQAELDRDEGRRADMAILDRFRTDYLTQLLRE
jgi:cell division septum initiation protein DivIVA